MISSADIFAANILIVDDREANILLLEGILGREGYTSISRTMNARDVCDLHQRHHYDLILLDLQMPEMDGFEVMEELKRLKLDDYLPVLVITAQPGHLQRALKAGARDFIGKPFDLAEVLIRVYNLLEVRLLHKQLQRYSEKLEIRNKFICETVGRHLSEKVMTSLLAAPEVLRLGGDTQQVTLIMADLRGLTGVSEKQWAEHGATVVDRCLDKMVETLLDYGATLDGFTDGGIVGLFGAPTERPDDAERAVTCALAMQAAMDSIRALCQFHGMPPAELGIGLHTGAVVVGNIGSTQRANYGVLGNAVALTARIQAFAKPGQILMSQATFEAVRGSVMVGYPPFAESLVEAEGASPPIRVYDVVVPPHGHALPPVAAGVSN